MLDSQYNNMVDTVVGIPKMLRNKLFCALALTVVASIFVPAVLGTKKESTDLFNYRAFGSDMFENHDYLVSYDSNAFLPDRKLEPICVAFLNKYAELASKFIKCALEHARPLNFCETCVGEFVQAKSVFDYIMQGEGHDQHGKPCRDVLLNADRTQVVVITNRYIQNLWDSSNCRNCFDVYEDNNGTVEASLNNDTMKFLELMNETESCFSEFMNGSEILPLNETGNHSACKECEAIYKELNQQYNAMGTKFNKEICMDVVDKMNYTRLAWSQEFGCTQLGHKSYLVGVVSAIIAVLSFGFYCGLYLFAGDPKRTVSDPQKRRRSDVIGINDGVTPSCSTAPHSSSEE